MRSMAGMPSVSPKCTESARNPAQNLRHHCGCLLSEVAPDKDDIDYGIGLCGYPPDDTDIHLLGVTGAPVGHHLVEGAAHGGYTTGVDRGSCGVDAGSTRV